MAVNDPTYRYATQTWEADGVRTQYEIAFDGGYIRQSDVVAFSVLVDEDTGLTTDRTIHALTFLSEEVDPDTEWKTATVQITPAVPAGRRVVIFRSTEKSEGLVNYTNGSVLTEKNLDLANDQAIFGIAEIMDGLANVGLTVEQTVGVVIDMNELIREIYENVLELLASGGIISVEPRVWSGVGDGETLDWPLLGADVDDAGFYDTYVAGAGVIPDTDYSILTSDTPADTLIHFETPVPDGVVWFTVLRGYAKPYTGPAPITSMDIPIFDTDLALFFADEAVRWGLVRCNNGTGCEVAIKEINPLNENRLNTGSYFSFVQRGLEPVTIVGDSLDVTVNVPAGCLPQTRAYNSTITATCEDADSNIWLLSGDLEQE